MSSNNNNITHTTTTNNQSDMDAYKAFMGASSGQDIGATAAAAQALASLSSAAPTSTVPAPAGTAAPSSYDLQSFYAQQVQQLTAAPQQQQTQTQALLKSIPTELLQAYLANTAPHQSSFLHSAPAPQAHQQLQRHQVFNAQANAQANAIVAQLFASSQANAQRPYHVPSNVSSMMQPDLLGSMARTGPINHEINSANQVMNAVPGVLQQTQGAAAAATAPSLSLPNSIPDNNNDPVTAKTSSVPPKKRTSKKARLKSIAGRAETEEEKKLAKRAANRLSAHLSRKRKKMYIDDVTSENIELRRKVQILQFIPDLIVVFDSSGSISFASQSVSAFVDTPGQNLEGKSLWDYLTEDSVNSIKSAFMDALAQKRNEDDDSTLLCHGGSLLVKLVDRKCVGGEPCILSLKGVVHFNDNAPECISSLRPVAKSTRSFDAPNEAQEQEANRSLCDDAKTHDVSDVESRKANIESSNDQSDAESRKAFTESSSSISD